MKTMKPTFIMGMLAICMGMMSCQDDEDTNISTIKPGTYSADIIVNSESGSTNYSRGIDVETGIFTSTYEQNYIYLHHADGNGEIGEALYIPMRTDCGEDKCFNIQVTKNGDNGDNISYTIITKDTIGTPQSMTINANEQIYFSTMKDQIWESETSSTNLSPIKDITILQQPTKVEDIKSREILRSELYTGEGLLELMTGDTQYIDLTRHVTGFKIHILFTNANVAENEDHILDVDGWHDALGENVNHGDFNIKIYFGPNFAQWYNILKNYSQGFGYYASNNQMYVPFEKVNQTITNITYTGYGYNTTYTLLSPLYRTSLNEEEYEKFQFRIYMCIQYKDGQEFYTKIYPKNLTLNTNTIHHMILAFDVHDLIPIVTEKGGTYSTRSSSSTFQKIDIKPIKVICKNKLCRAA